MSKAMLTPSEAPRTAPTRGRRWVWVGIGLGVVAFAVASAAVWYARAERSRTADGAHGDTRQGISLDGGSDEPIPVETVRLSKGGIVRTSTQVGSVYPFQDADLYSKVSGYLKTLNVDYGDKVRKGELVAVIDDPEVNKEADRAEGALLQAKAAVKQAEARVETAKADQKSAAAEVERARADIERYASERAYREKVLNRHRGLVAKQALPQEVVDEDEEHLHAAMSAESAARAAVITARAQAAAAQARVEQAVADLAAAVANVEVAEANLAKAKVFVGYTEIRSPYDGVITRREFFPGAFIRSASDGGALPLLSVARIDWVRVVTHVPDRDVPYIDVGDPVEVTLDALGSEVFKGKVSRFSNSEDPSSRTMYTEIELPNPDGRIRPGMYGIAKIILDTSTRGWTLPASCLVGDTKDGQGEVFVVKNGKARKTPIKIGADDGLRVEVLSGLSPDDDVILAPTSVTDGMPVRAVPAGQPGTGGQPKTARRDAINDPGSDGLVAASLGSLTGVSARFPGPKRCRDRMALT